MGDYDFKLFDEGCTDCASPATNISLGDGKCSACHGTGHELSQDCTVCGGSGKCQTCNGSGKH